MNYENGTLNLDINYQNMEELSNFIFDKSKELKTNLDEMYLLHEELGEFYKGPDKNYFTEEVLSYKDKFYHLKDILDDYATLIFDISKNYYELENNISNKAKEL